MFVHLTKRAKFLVRVRLFNKRTNTNELPAERFTNCSPNFVCSPSCDNKHMHRRDSLLIGSHEKEKGTGDLMTALLLGWSNKYPNNLEKAAELAVSSLQAVLSRTLKDYEKAGYDPQTSSLEIRLIQSQDDIRDPEITYNAHIYD
ncbi:putative pyridoxal kinase [Helianthus annuus]|nr:putative pyridoxal kinase [Helianthus annuus]